MRYIVILIVLLGSSCEKGLKIYECTGKCKSIKYDMLTVGGVTVYDHYLKLRSDTLNYDSIVAAACIYYDTTTSYLPILTINFIAKRNKEMGKDHDEINWGKIRKDQIISIYYSLDEEQSEDCPTIRDIYPQELKSKIKLFQNREDIYYENIR